MDKLGNEVASRIRNKIKDKLVELGAYVDDELPDYIMVMVANKKTKAQMTEDLSLFLGDSTQNFTDWLHNALEHLQTLASESKTKSQPKEEAKPSVRRASVTKQPVKAKAEDADTSTKIPIIVEKELEPDDGDEVLALKPDPEQDDVLAEELQDDTYLQPPTKQAAVKPIQHSVPTPAVEPVRVSPVKVLPQKRTPITSTIGSFVKRKPQFISDDEEEEYDPNNPSVGSVASVVKVTERSPVLRKEKHERLDVSSVPPSLQANKLLILKAMKEAHKSVSVDKKNQVRIEPYKPTPIKELNSKKRTVEKTSMQKQDEEEIVPQKKLALSPVIKTIVKPVEHPVRQATRIYKITATDESENKSIQIPIKASRKLGIFLQEQKEQAVSLEEDPAMNFTVTRNLTLSEEVEDDEDLLELTVAGDDVRAVEQGRPENLQPSVRIAPTKRTSVKTVQEAEKMKKENQWPHFIVTLDGVDPTSFSSSRAVVSSEEMVEEEEEVLSVKEEPIEEVVMEEMPAEEELMDAEEEEERVEKVNERCRYWPACKNGDQCQYHHPMVPCKAFPNCKFKEKCLYIHPNCKFDAFCKKKDCPFTHASKRVFSAVPSAPAVAQSPVQYCKFYPHCTNLKCRYFHPKPCRFGLRCQASGCPYTHPSAFPTLEKLKWTSPEVKACEVPAVTAEAK